MDFEPSLHRRRASAQERSRVVGLYRASGLTQGQFATQHGIKLSTLRQWLYRPDSKMKGNIPARFQEFAAGPVISAAWMAEIALDCGITLRLGAAANPDWVSSVVSALRQRPC